MKVQKANKGLSKIKKAAGYVSTFATIGVLVTSFILKRKKKKYNEA
jgi:hypothetical protein